MCSSLIEDGGSGGNGVPSGEGFTSRAVSVEDGEAAKQRPLRWQRASASSPMFRGMGVETLVHVKDPLRVVKTNPQPSTTA